MAFRSKAQAGALLILGFSTSLFAAEPLAFQARREPADKLRNPYKRRRFICNGSSD
jgi:hypothetical protein